jgi:hypothetical protein
MPFTFLSPNSKLISVLITASGGTTVSSYTFPTQQDLENHKIIAIESFCADDMGLDPLNPAVPVLTSAIFNNAFLTLYTAPVKTKNTMTQKQEAGLFYDKIPLIRLRNVENNNTSGSVTASGSRELFLIRPTELTFNKTKVEFPNNQAIANTFSAVFLFHYLDKYDDGDYYMRAMGYPPLKP